MGLTLLLSESVLAVRASEKYGKTASVFLPERAFIRFAPIEQSEIEVKTDICERLSACRYAPRAAKFLGKLGMTVLKPQKTVKTKNI